MKLSMFLLVLIFTPLVGHADNSLTNEATAHLEDAVLENQTGENLLNKNFADHDPLMANIAAAEQLLEQEEFVAAVRQLKDLSRKHSDNAAVWSLLGMASHKKGNFLGSMVAFEKSLKLNPDNRQTLSRQADLFISMGDKWSAKSNLDRLHKLCPNGCEQIDRITAELDF